MNSVGPDQPKVQGNLCKKKIELFFLFKLHNEYIIKRKKLGHTDNPRSSEDNSNGLNFYCLERMIPSLSEHSVGTCCVPGTVPGHGGTAANGWGMVPVLMGFRPVDD